MSSCISHVLAIHGQETRSWAGETPSRWTVPVDDERHLELSLYLADATEEQAREYRESRGEVVKELQQVPVYELLQAVLNGRMSTEELAKYSMLGGSLQDGVARWGQGTIVDRRQDHLGRADAAPILYRRLFMRELQAQAEGRPLKQWTCPAGIQADWD